MPQDSGKDKDSSIFGGLWRASMVGIHLVIATFVGFFIGHYLDKFFGTKPWLTIVFLILGLVTGFRDLFRMTKAINDTGDKTDNDDEKSL